jgi:hypothetical protein
VKNKKIPICAAPDTDSIKNQWQQKTSGSERIRACRPDFAKRFCAGRPKRDKMQKIGQK